MDNDKIAFLEKYTASASEIIFGKIWEAKLSNATNLDISGRKVRDLIQRRIGFHALLHH